VVVILLFLCIFAKNFNVMKKTSLITIVVIGSMLLTASGVLGAGLKNYQCKKCSVVVRAESIPPTMGCRVDNVHQWQELGAVGAMNYHCMKCRVDVESQWEPSTQNCPASGNHQWNRLGKIGPLNFQCRKCGLTIRTEDTPNPIGCPNGGNHQWYKSR
jgi:DNA-directed RNA polymerase subunit RPC12/RpoP